MDLAAIVDDEFIQALRGAIVAEDLVATRQLIDSISMQTTSTQDLEEVRVFAEDYILELRDGEQYKSPPTVEDIKVWLEAKGLDGILDPYAVTANILAEGTTWDRKGGSSKLQEVLSPENIKRVMNIAIEELKADVNKTKWLLR